MVGLVKIRIRGTRFRLRSEGVFFRVGIRIRSVWYSVVGVVAFICRFVGSVGVLNFRFVFLVLF